MPKRDSYVTISTTFSGEHAKLINELTERYHTSKPNALRLFLNDFTKGGIAHINPEVRARIDMLLKNPLISRQFGISTTEEFVDYALNKVLMDLQRELKDLRDPAVQLMLDEDELEVARVLLRRCETIENYGGIELKELANNCHMNEKYVRRILDAFIQNGWVGKTRGGRYLPLKYLSP